MGISTIVPQPISESSTACFDRHATYEVKKSLALIGDYHMFLIDRALTKRKSQVLSIKTITNISPHKCMPYAPR